MPRELLNIPVSDITPPRVMLSLVDKDSLDYLELKYSIQHDGILQSLTVKKINDTGKYQIITGVKRFSVAQDLCLETVPCIVMDNISTSEIIIQQIQENCCRHDIRSLDLSTHFKKLLLLNPELTFVDLAGMVHKSQAWVKKILSLQTLNPVAKKLMETDAISLSAATVLARLPSSLQVDMVDASFDMESKDFLLECRRIRKIYRKATAEGKLVKKQTYSKAIPEPSIRPLSEVRAEYQTNIYGETYIQKHEKATKLDVWKEAIKWMLRVDPESIRKHREKLNTQECLRQKRMQRKDIGSKLKKKP